MHCANVQTAKLQSKARAAWLFGEALTKWRVGGDRLVVVQASGLGVWDLICHTSKLSWYIRVHYIRKLLA
jgi:hypothetical protein